MSESKTSTLDTLTQILDLLKNTHSKSELGDLLPRNRLTSPLTYNIHNYLEVISDEDKDLLNNNVSLIGAKEDQIDSNSKPEISWNILINFS